MLVWKAALTAMVGVGLAGIAHLGAQVRQGSAQSQGSASGSGSYLGTWLWEVDPARAREMRLPPDAHVVVTLVRPGSPAEIAGLRVGDVLLEYDQKRVESNDQFSRMVRETPAGRTVRIRIMRNGVQQTVTAKIENIPDAERPGPIVGMPPTQAMIERQDVPRSVMTWSSALLGIDAEPLFGQLASYFGASEGVLVRSVTPGLAGARAGLKAGDVIVRVGKDTVATPAELTGRLRLANSTSVKLAVMRDRHEISVTVSLE
jgi:serine protease Do